MLDFINSPMMLDFFYVLLWSFVCAIAARMVMYSLSFRQILGFLKIWVAKKVDKVITEGVLKDVSSQSDGEDKLEALYDYLSTQNNNKFWNFLFRLIDCPYCIGFWLSVLVLAACFINGVDFYYLIPFFTFYLISKI